ncbi:PREDICTED: transcription factor GTE4-like isoform 2 [Fragaria vesca subsp. vesca]|uniref:transcription factor GTE3, chloroplastic isoform X2 n=1 Tax=Fragaria vesca subsp. vesca TaxID=101020 RepID=UPI0002C369A5|nr:PREDICTED: transcription factor GTE3, chloroplastic isoform X2 [Fragaria vesca subsp. vesca]
MVSGPLVGDEASNRFYSRNAQNPNHVIRHSPEQQSLMQQFRGETASFDSSNNGLAEPGNGPRGYSKVGDKVRICLNSKADINGIKWKLMGELEQVRSLVRNLEAKEAQLTEGYGFSQKSDHNLVDNNNRSTMSFRGIGVCNAENENKGGEGVEKKKRKTPKGDQSSRNLKLPPSGGKKNLGRKSEVGLLLGPDKNSSRLLKSCTTLLEKLMKHKHGWVFNKPVDAKGLGLHDYYKIVKHPMDLGTVKSRLDKNWYKTAAEFAEDVRLTFNNAMLYNPKEQDVHVMAALLLKLFEEKWAAIEDQYNLNRRAEIGNDSEFPTPASRDVEAPAQYNINRRVEMGNNSEVPTPMSRKVQGPAHNINRRIGMGNSSELPTPISRKVQAPPPPLPSPSPRPLEMRTLDRAESMTKPVDPKLKPASVGHTGRKPVPKKPKARDPDKRDMNMEEKQKLSTDLQALPSEKLANVVQIVRKRCQGILQQDDEIELDIGSVDPETLWELDRFVTNYKKSLTKNKRKAELAPLSVEESDYAMQENVAQATVEAQHEPIAVEYNDNASSPVQREDQGGNVSGSSSSSSGSGSSSSDSDNDSSSGSGSYSNC